MPLYSWRSKVVMIVGFGFRVQRASGFQGFRVVLSLFFVGGCFGLGLMVEG